MPPAILDMDGGLEHVVAVDGDGAVWAWGDDRCGQLGNGDLISSDAPRKVELPFTDSDFQSDVDDRKSISGFIFTCNGGAVSWKSSKQTITADSTTEAEYIAASDAAKEAVWIRKFVSELGVVPSIESAVPLFCDNNEAIALEKEPRSQRSLCRR